MTKEILTLEDALAKAENFITTIPPFPSGYEGRGVIICGGGLKYFTNAWVAIRILRKLGCNLPLQVWYR